MIGMIEHTSCRLARILHYMRLRTAVSPVVLGTIKTHPRYPKSRLHLSNYVFLAVTPDKHRERRINSLKRRINSHVTPKKTEVPKIPGIRRSPNGHHASPLGESTHCFRK
jgi:hypothetical protein